MSIYNDIKKGEIGAWLSIIAYLVLSVFKITMGSYTNSEALFADGLNNTSDIIASAVILIGLRISRKPPDHNHPYGHFRAQTLAALLASFLMAIVGIQVLFHAGQSLTAPEIASPDWTAAWVALIGALCMYLVYLFNRNLAKKINNQALMAAAYDNRSDALVSIGVAVGISGSQFGFPWLDPLAAFAVGAIICKTAWDIFKQSSYALTDGFDPRDLRSLRHDIQQIKGVEAIKDVKARVHGSHILIDVIVEVNPYLNVVESHAISEDIENRLLKEHNIIHVHVHIEPCEKK
jgi:cation diffusion facilitator family transporter